MFTLPHLTLKPTTSPIYHTMSKLLTVFAATGQQGGSIIRTIQASPSLSSIWKLRAITRDVKSNAAAALASSGVQVVSADIEHPETLSKAVEGSDAVYAFTLTIVDTDEEIKQGKAIADACLAAKVKHIIWSSVPSPRKISNNKLQNVVHFEAKNKVMEYIESIKGQGGMIASYFEPSTFMSNFERHLTPNSEGIRMINFPWGDGDQAKVPLIDIANDTGTYVGALLSADPKTVDGLRAQAVTEWITPNQIARTLSEVTGKPFQYNEVTSEAFGSFLSPAISTRMAEMMESLRDYSYFGKGAEKNQSRLDEQLGIKEKSSLTRWAKESKALSAL